MFIENVGQFPVPAGVAQAASPRFQVRGAGYTTYLAPDAIWITLLQPITPTIASGSARVSRSGTTPIATPLPDTQKPRASVNLRISFSGANPNPQVEGFNPLETHVSYFIGQNASQWRPNVPVWGGVRYVDLYPGIDLEITSSGSQWAWRLVLHANGAAQLANVRIRVEGAQALALDKASQALHVVTGVGNLALPLLSVVGANGTTLGSPATDNDEVTSPFASPASVGPASALPAPVGHTDTSRRPLIGPLTCCDPSQLQYSTFLGGSNGDETGTAIAVDPSGAAYVTGVTSSTDFTYTVGYTQTNKGNGDMFVARLMADGRSLFYLTYLGGSYEDDGNGIAVDGNGAAYIAGRTLSGDFPMVNAYQNVFSGTAGVDANPVVAKLDAMGTHLVYATYLGTGEGHNVAVRPGVNDVFYVTGQTGSFPTTANAFTTTLGGGTDGFVAKIDTTQSPTNTLVYATYLGGNADECERNSPMRECAIAVDADGFVYVTGPTYSNNFPTTASGYRRTCGTDGNCNGGQYTDMFLVKLDLTTGVNGLVYGTYLGGSGSDCYLTCAWHWMGARMSTLSARQVRPTFQSRPGK